LEHKTAVKEYCWDRRWTCRSQAPLQRRQRF